MFTHSKLTIILDNFEIMHNISGILLQISFPRLELVRFTNIMNLITLKYANYIINQRYEQQVTKAQLYRCTRARPLKGKYNYFN